jgi:hypothetical protein
MIGASGSGERFLPGPYREPGTGISQSHRHRELPGIRLTALMTADERLLAYGAAGHIAEGLEVKGTRTLGVGGQGTSADRLTRWTSSRVHRSQGARPCVGARRAKNELHRYVRHRTERAVPSA